MEIEQSLNVVIVVFVVIILVAVIAFGIVYGVLNLRMPGTNGGMVDLIKGEASSGTIIYKLDDHNNLPLELPESARQQ